ncbi:MAG: response regulator transcription factor [Chloroflexi bacterium]|nr:response regulator transcription factor [Chloroflexota bacterium]
MAAGEPDAISTLRRPAPEVIVLDAGDPSLGEGVITHLLDQYPDARVVAVDLNRTEIEVYRVRRVGATDLDGLLQAIRGRRLGRKESGQKTTDTVESGEEGEAIGR